MLISPKKKLICKIKGKKMHIIGKFIKSRSTKDLKKLDKKNI